jgi:hypothetical protein
MMRDRLKKQFRVDVTVTQGVSVGLVPTRLPKFCGTLLVRACPKRLIPALFLSPASPLGNGSMAWQFHQGFVL